MEYDDALFGRMAPETWCVLGNCFSLQREFEVAIKFFQRAVQVRMRVQFASWTQAFVHTYAGTDMKNNLDIFSSCEIADAL